MRQAVGHVQIGQNVERRSAKREHYRLVHAPPPDEEQCGEKPEGRAACTASGHLSDVIGPTMRRMRGEEIQEGKAQVKLALDEKRAVSHYDWLDFGTLAAMPVADAAEHGPSAM